MTGGQPMIELEVNGHPQRVQVAPNTALMHVLRNHLGLKGVRAGCSIGECGACRIHLEGEAVASCITPVSEAENRRVVTPEGLGTPDAPHPVQQAFLEEQAAQCGYCINGMIMSVAARLEHEPAPDADALRDTLDEHLCRCGTQLRILRAANRAAGLAGSTAHDDVVVEPLDGSDERLATTIPAVVGDHPELTDWLELDGDGEIWIKPGKVELGQGLRTALLQIVASHVGVPIERVHALPTVTGRSPDQGQTSGSFSIEHGGVALAMAARALRRVLTDRAGQHLDVPVSQLRLDGAEISDGDRSATLAELAALGPVTGTIETTDLPTWDGGLLGQPLQREDLRQKLTGAAAYVHDRSETGMVHARAVLPPSYEAELESFDADAARGLDGVVGLVHDDRLIIVIAEHEEDAIRAQTRLQRSTRWTPGAGIRERDTEQLLRDIEGREHIRERSDGVAEALASGDVHRASYVRPYQTHGPMSPSAAVARADVDDRLYVWTHSQGIYPLRREMATVLGLDEERLVVEHSDGPGCYGMNGADDAALLAAIAARAVPGRAVRFQFSIDDEFGWDPYGPGMVADLAATLDEDGRIRAWQHEVITDSHSTRPNGDGDRLLASWLSREGPDRPWVGLGEPGVRNAKPLYDIPLVDVTAKEVRGPLRTGPLRSLGAFFNVFAAESFMDELAERAGQDPLAFRLAHLRDQRAARVLEVVAERADWRPHVGPSGRGLGLAVARYKDTKGYAAVVAEVEVDPEHGALRVVHVRVACDAGSVINADGLRNQLEGGVLQGVSRTLFEELHLAENGVREQDWTTYPALRFATVPDVTITLVDRPGAPPLGAGEVSTPAVPAAVANAIDDAIGIRLRRLPLTPERLQRRLLDMSAEEMSRVLV